MILYHILWHTSINIAEIYRCEDILCVVFEFIMIHIIMLSFSATDHVSEKQQ